MRASPAVPILLALATPALAAPDAVELPRLGVVVSDVTPEIARRADLDRVKGCVVLSVRPGSPAALGHVEPGDIIVSLEGRGIRDAAQLRSDVAGVAPGEVVDMCVVRDDYRTTIHVTLGTAPPGSAVTHTPGWLGVEVTDVHEGSLESQRLAQAGKEGGVLVERVADGSPAGAAGILRDDVIMSFNSRKVRTVRELSTDLAGSAPGDRVRICIMRGEIRKTVYPVLEQPPGAAVSLTAGDSGARQPTRGQLAALFPGASGFSRELRPVPHYRALRGDAQLGVAVVTTEVCPEQSQGYQGPIATLIGLSMTGQIVGVLVLEHTESLKYTRDHLEQFVNQYEGKDGNGPFVLGRDVDAITGATVTSSAINRSVAVASGIVLARVLKTRTAAAARESPPLVLGLDAILLLGMVLLAVAGYLRGSQTVRFVVLGMAVLFLGHIKGGGLSLHDGINLLQGDLPALADTLYWHTLVGVVVLTTLLVGRFYCGWLCPFGALTEMLHRAVPRLQVRVPLRLDRALRLVKYLVLLGVLLAVLFVGQSQLTGAVIEVVEPFGTVFRLSGTLLSFVTAGLFVLASLFVSRAYCRYLCPLGALLALVTVLVSFVRHALAGTAPAPRHRELAAAVGGCPVNAVRHESNWAEQGIRSGECIVCCPPLCAREREVRGSRALPAGERESAG